MPRPVTHVSHDPFARTSILRITLPAESRSSCKWCGGAPGRFVYGQQNDDRAGIRSPDWSKHAFCSISCWRAYGS